MKRLSRGFAAVSGASRLSGPAARSGRRTAISMVCTLAICTAGLARAATEAESGSAFVFLDKGALSFWHTATNATLSLPVEFPDGVSSATLSVTAPGYSAQYQIASSGLFTLTLPAATSPSAENVYDLSLDLGNGVVRTAKLGLIEGNDATSEGATRCLAPATDRKWGRAEKRTVIPIPCGIASFTVDGVAADTGLDGDAGWYPLTLRGGQTADLDLDDGGETFAATLFRPQEATVLQLR